MQEFGFSPVALMVIEKSLHDTYLGIGILDAAWKGWPRHYGIFG